MAYKYGNVEITFLKHAGFKIKGSKTIYIDPYDLPDGLEKADYIFVTHDHFDHKDIGSIRRLSKHDTTVVIPSGCLLEGYRTCELDIGEEEDLNGVKVKTVPAYNIDKPFHPKGIGVGYIIEMDGVRIYHAGDTDFIPEMKDVEADIALIPVGGKYTMDMEQAKKAIEVIKAKVVVPMHYGTLPETKADVEKLKSDRVVVLEPEFK
ncbi:putative Zn-dependent hydrolases of the beta-lactamase fold protein [Archaeoglobus sulfaticallidus PM70-1]|uniref:Putative Zn-dependent hydrolases of the beta-lactamase fold protein n=1 Tax=Archaeoglobus sulfaticallidus PM70-1 TaxID=387631 RepID=N0BKZ1_9EURY|nr:MBL fold metallo-hydrolase [Archaeoglobus sulfaticallidus]AGK61201.1 putative Zn-dependent hydrolases of the beta-lactamase fold protein [Archaeoglobus sulfaticallidus PM70-1]